MQPVRTAVTLRRKRGELSFTNGPFAETNEQLAGFVMIEPADLETAKEIARVLAAGVLGTDRAPAGVGAGGPAGPQGDCCGVIVHTVLMVGHFCSSAPPPLRPSGECILLHPWELRAYALA